MLVKLTSGVNFTNMLMRSFYARRSQKRKKTVKSSAEKSWPTCCAAVLQQICALLCALKFDEIDPSGLFHRDFTSSFCPISLHQKSTNLKCKYRKAAQKSFVWKSCPWKVGEIGPRSKLIKSKWFIVPFLFVFAKISSEIHSARQNNFFSFFSKLGETESKNKESHVVKAIL